MADHLNARLFDKAVPNLVPELRAYLDRHRTQLARMLDQPRESGTALCRRHAKIMDGLLSVLYQAASALMTHQRRWVPVLLGAVGGYGRGLVGLKSDVDVRLLTTHRAEPIGPMAEILLRPLRDAGVSIGHRIVTVSDALSAARTDLPTAIALLDLRPIAGDAAAGRALMGRAFSELLTDAELPGFIQRLGAEVDDRHRRFGDPAHLLEPDVQNGPGGLRDLDVALWAARARWRADSLMDLVRLGVLGAREADEIDSARDFLWSVRNHLHHRAGRRSDRLSLDEQEGIARAMGYQARRRGAPCASRSGPVVEQLLSDCHRHGQTIARAREQILARAASSQGSRGPKASEGRCGRKRRPPGHA